MKLKLTAKGFIFLSTILALLLICAPAWAVVSGQRLWVKRYNGGQNDDAKAIALDSKGNVVVTGSSEKAWVEDFMTVKYDSAGRLKWARRYDSGGADDIATDIAIDKNNNIYVTGKSWQLNRWKYDYLTIKYGPNGAKLWSRRYNGPSDGNDEPAGIAIDPSGNVLVAGSSNGFRPGALDWDDDFLIVKYGPDGTEKWTRRLRGVTGGNEGAAGLAVDRSGNVFITGFSDNSAGKADYLTAKYGPAGKLKWKRRYDGAVHGHDFPKAIGVDAAGNAYVTGKVPENTNAYPPTDIVTIKYDASGNRKWVIAAGIAGKTDEASDLAVDRFNNIYICGGVSPAASTDFFLIKYNAAGVEKWNLAVDSDPARAFADNAFAVAADAAGNAYVTGNTELNDIFDYATVRFNAAGSVAWLQSYGGPGNDWDVAFDIAVNAGGVYVTGNSHGGTTWRDFATVKYAK